MQTFAFAAGEESAPDRVVGKESAIAALQAAHAETGGLIATYTSESDAARFEVLLATDFGSETSMIKVRTEAGAEIEEVLMWNMWREPFTSERVRGTRFAMGSCGKPND